MKEKKSSQKKTITQEGKSLVVESTETVFEKDYDKTDHDAASPPLVRESKTVLHSGFHAVDSGFQVLDSSVLSGTWILDSNSECMGLRIP